VRRHRGFLVISFALFCAANSFAQKEKREPLTEAQVEQIREAGL